jgi:hypothetical protein
MQEDQKIEEYVILDDFSDEKGENWKKKLKDFISGKYFILVVIILLAIIAFSLGRISGLQEKRPPVRIISDDSGSARLASESVASGEVKGASTNQEGSVVASKSGTKYH